MAKSRDRRLRSAREIQLESQREDVRLKRAERLKVEQQIAERWIFVALFVVLALAGIILACLEHPAAAAGSGAAGVASAVASTFGKIGSRP